MCEEPAWKRDFVLHFGGSFSRNEFNLVMYGGLFYVYNVGPRKICRFCLVLVNGINIRYRNVAVAYVVLTKIQKKLLSNFHNYAQVTSWSYAKLFLSQISQSYLCNLIHFKIAMPLKFSIQESHVLRIQTGGLLRFCWVFYDDEVLLLLPKII